jgi:hypothetical protein
MAINLDQGKARTNNSKPQTKPGAITKPVAIPALKALEHQLDTQKDKLKDQARDLVQAKMAQAQAEVRDVVSEELAAIAGDDDFFGFGSMFSLMPEQTPIDEPEPPAAEQTIDAPVLAVPV